MDPTRCLGSLESYASLVSNSGVATVVLRYRKADEAGLFVACLRWLYAIKTNDGLWQNAPVFQFFQLMEIVWAEHYLIESPKPYIILALPPKKALAAFVRPKPGSS